MPGFEGALSDAEIRAALAFIKSTWPERERGFQERQSRFEREAQVLGGTFAEIGGEIEHRSLLLLCAVYRTRCAAAARW